MLGFGGRDSERGSGRCVGEGAVFGGEVKAGWQWWLWL